VGFGTRAKRSKGHPLFVMAHLKISFVEVKATENCFSHALTIAIAKVDNNPNYTSYRDGRNILPIVPKLFVKTGIDLSGGGEYPK
jgi:hypothetical protein